MIHEIQLNLIETDPNQPRKHIDTEKVRELAASMQSVGLLVPVLVRPNGSERFVIVNGERRYRAAKLLGWKSIRAEVSNISQESAFSLALIENIQRDDLNPIDEAYAYKKLSERGMTHSQIGHLISKSSQYVSRRLKLLQLPSEVQDLVASRAINLSIGAQIATIDDPELQIDLARKFAQGKLALETLRRELRGQPATNPRFDSLIKPSDNWNFSPLRYPRIDDNNTHGYIPGDIYANCFWYFAKSGDLVVDPMAGSGMAKLVYDDRAKWMGNYTYDFSLCLFDLSPQEAFIEQHNLLDFFPVELADYIFIDLPYYGMGRGAYSSDPNDLSNMSWDEYLASLTCISQHCASAQEPKKLCTVVSPNYSDVNTGDLILVTDHIADAWKSTGYKLFHKAYATRRIQQEQSTQMAIMNNLAKANRVMLTDISEIMTFKKI